MKPCYEKQGSADADDVELQQQIELGHVPAGCLMLGQIVRRAVQAGSDPCSECLVTRSKCGGRAGNAEAQREMDARTRAPRRPQAGGDGGYASARKLVRSEQIDRILKILGPPQ